MKKVTKAELRYVLITVLFSLGTFFITFGIQEWLKTVFPNIQTSMVISIAIGLGILVGSAYFFRVKK